jgi:hypothetical protein
VTATATAKSTAQNGQAAIRRPLASPARQRSTPLIVLGVLLCFAGALAFGALNIRMSKGRDVLVVARQVPAGHIILASDLRVAKVSGDAVSAAVPASARDSVVGRAAALDLAKGSVLVRSQVGATASLRPGEAVVGLALKPGQSPSSLRVGDLVLLVDTAPNASSEPVRGRIADVGQHNDGGATEVSVVVEQADAASIAVSSSAGHLSVVVLPPPA